MSEKNLRSLTSRALAWLRMLDNPAIRFRFDIVEVVIDDTGPTLKVIQNAFGLPEPYLY